ncbi:MAG TPA: hypothetical protein VD969_28140 [Symbiobacteriaceae bacterium]|nr:hypothetical protein [Symbiobacteriaceae bacterium]
MPLWEVTVREYGQVCFDERSGTLAAHGDQWAFVVQPESWAPAPGNSLATGARFVLQDLRGRKNDLSLATALLLQLAGPPTAAVPNRAVLELARTAPGEGMRSRLRAAARLQRQWGWEPDFTGWPDGDEEWAAASTAYRNSGVHQA